VANSELSVCSWARRSAQPAPTKEFGLARGEGRLACKAGEFATSVPTFSIATYPQACSTTKRLRNAPNSLQNAPCVKSVAHHRKRVGAPKRIVPSCTYVIDYICVGEHSRSMKAVLIQSEKEVFENGAIRQVTIWLVPQPVPPATHRFKYRLVYVMGGVRVIGFDNERGKGDHRHLHGVETSYEFGGIAKLLADFRELIKAERGG